MTQGVHSSGTLAGLYESYKVENQLDWDGPLVFLVLSLTKICNHRGYMVKKKIKFHVSYSCLKQILTKISLK